MAESTPMMQQYLETKKQYPGLHSVFTVWAIFMKCSLTTR